MIREISVKNLALIEDIRISFDQGFSVFTGETGAGKSILIGAIGLLLGDRAFSEMVRSGAQEAHVTGIFDINDPSPAFLDFLQEHDLSLDEDQLIVRRVISLTGRNRVHLNQTPVPLALLKEIGDRLVDFHSQFEHQSLLRPETAFDIVNGLPGVLNPFTDYAKAFERYEHARTQLASHDQTAQELRQRRDFLEFQFKEISTLELKLEEEELLEEELKLLSSAAQRTESAAAIVSILSEGQDSVNRGISQIKKRLESLAKYDPSANAWLNDIDTAARTLSELETFCGSYVGQLELSDAPARIEAINDRLAAIQKLKKKYKCSVEDLLKMQEDLGSKLASVENLESDRSELEKHLTLSQQAVQSTGTALRKARQNACKQFDREVGTQMEKLGFQGGSWKTAMTPHDQPTAQGLEQIEFLVRTNPGEPFLPLAKSASGGEISRLMLAIKTVVSDHDQIPILVFDEIDTGIGGVLAREVAKALAGLSGTHQVLCISHLHQIASRADHHYSVFKFTKDKRTVTEVKKLNKEEKVAEIARMLGGDSEITRKHARQLLAEQD